MVLGAGRPETAGVNTAEASTEGTAGLEGTAGIETTLIAAKWDKANKDLYPLLSLTVGEVGGALTGFIRKSGGNWQLAWMALMDKYIYIYIYYTRARRSFGLQ